MIIGVTVKQLVVHRDLPDRKEDPAGGFLVEVLRNDDRLLTKFGQTTFTVAYKGAIKAFHWHQKQDDLWFVATGKARVVLFDRREGSSTEGKTQVVTAGEDDYKLIVIPVGVAHGYQVLSDKPVMLFYTTTESYDPDKPDEQRIAFDDTEINFDWSV